MSIKPNRIKTILKFVNQSNLKVLDIGSGSHSASITKKWFPGCYYTGVDRDKSYNNDERDLHAMDNFIEMDLTQLQFERIPDNYFDVVIMSHVVEHLYNGERVVTGLMTKLKAGGIIYIEFPSEKSISFPSMHETLNFFDDPTHCRIYSLKEICNLLMQNGFKILRAGKSRRLINILLIPVKVVFQLLTKGYIRAGVFWDLYGFAEYVVARK
jgi:2-polyprenyl-3-methyl-5-hydroxy-6-metoxy-1,4-benzoquinol methylase